MIDNFVIFNDQDFALGTASTFEEAEIMVENIIESHIRYIDSMMTGEDALTLLEKEEHKCQLRPDYKIMSSVEWMALPNIPRDSK